MSLADVNLWADTIIQLHARWKPHEGQDPIIEDIITAEVNSAFVRCGRKWGKTDIALYLLWRLGQSYPGSPLYYFGPLQNQARDIIWTDPRIKDFGPREWLLEGSRGINETQMLLRFRNGSFIKVDGTDNYDRYRGVKYRLAVYDEYKDCDPRMRKAMRPNASVLGGIDLFMGSPPEVGGTDYELLDKEHQSEQGMRSYHGPTRQNPHIPKQWLYDERMRLYRRGEGDEWEREYEAKYVKGGASAIFPMLDQSMVKPHGKIMAELFRDRRKLKWYAWSDPAGSSCFGVLFVAINPYSKRVYVLDEIYETQQREMTTKKVGSRLIDIRNDLYDRPDEWRLGYDEAATWFVNEWIDNFPAEGNLEPSRKAQNDKKDGLSLIKDIMLDGLLVISDRAKKFYWEADHYAKDKNGNVPKKDDHLLDCLRYILAADGYNLKGEREYVEDLDEDFRGESLESAISRDNEDPYEFS